MMFLYHVYLGVHTKVRRNITLRDRASTPCDPSHQTVLYAYKQALVAASSHAAGSGAHGRCQQDHSTTMPTRPLWHGRVGLARGSRSQRAQQAGARQNPCPNELRHVTHPEDDQRLSCVSAVVALARHTHSLSLSPCFPASNHQQPLPTFFLNDEDTHTPVATAADDVHRARIRVVLPLPVPCDA